MTIPTHIASAPLLRESGGYRVLPGLLDDRTFALLASEAEHAIAGSRESRVPRSDGAADWRGGSPARRFLSADGGPVQESYYQASGMAALLRDLLGCRAIPSGRRGTFTYYSRPGDFIGIHRDVDTCDVAAITCLRDSPTSDGGNAGKLVFYPSRLSDSNSRIRATPGEGAALHRLAPGETVILLGGVLAHAVLPVQPGQQRVVSVLCFTASPG